MNVQQFCLYKCVEKSKKVKIDKRCRRALRLSDHNERLKASARKWKVILVKVSQQKQNKPINITE